VIHGSDSMSPGSPVHPVMPSFEWRIGPRTRMRRASRILPMALHVALQSPHKTMPNLMFEPDELRNLIAYILTLKERE
jgi:hypothetical protein